MKRFITSCALALTLSLGVVLMSGATAFADFSYTVKKGDSLWKIAKEHFGNGAEYIKIYEANKAIIKDPSLIRVGWEIVIPGGNSVPVVPVAPETSENNNTPQIEKVKSYVGEGGWKINYNTDKYFLNDTLGDGEICFTYIGECSGTTAIIISYHPGKMPNEVLYEKVSGYDDARVSRGETMFANYWSHFRHIKPEHEDPNLGDVIYEGFTAIEHNGGTVLLNSISHLETDDKQYNEIMHSTTELLNSFELINHMPQTEYAYIPGKYIHKYTDEIEGTKVEIEDIVELYENHSCNIIFQDSTAGEWTGTKIILNDGSEYEYSIEGTTLNLNMNGEWISFEKA